MTRFIPSIKWLFVGIILLLVAVISVSNYIFSYKLHERHLNIYFLSLSSLIQKDVENLIKPAESFLYHIQSLVYYKILDFKDIEKTNKFLMDFMNKYPYITSINYGDGKGNGYLILNNDGKWLNRIKKSDEKDFVTWNEIDRNGKIISSKKVKDSYDPRNTVWYKQAIKNHDIHLSEEHIFRTTKDPGITASLLLSKETEEVVGIDIMIKDFSVFLNKIKQKIPYQDSKIYIVSNKNLLAATDEINFQAGKIYSINQKDFPLLYNALLINENSTTLKSSDFKGHKWFFKKELWKIGNRELAMFVFIPKSVITHTLRLYLLYQLIISLLLSFLVLIYISKKYMNPLINISQKISDLGLKEINLKNTAQRTDEIGILSKSISEASSEILKSKIILEQSERKCRTISNLAPVGIFLIDYETEKFVEANFSGLSMLGYTIDELKEKSLSDIFSPEILSEIKKLGEKESFETLCNVSDKNGKKLEFRIKAIKLMFENKIYILISADDVTKIRKLDKKIKEAEQFETVRRSLGEAVHRFKDLINVIHGFATLAQAKDTSDFVKNALDQILNASKRAIYLTKDLLTVTGDRKYNFQNVDLNSLILSMKTKIQAFVGGGVEVIFEIFENSFHVNLDIEAFDEVMMNLLSNAKDAMIKGGTLKIKTDFSFR